MISPRPTTPHLRRYATALLLIGIAFLFGTLRVAPAAAQDGELTGRILIATPELSDTNFARTVIYLVRHGKGGALGLVVNEPMGEVPLKRLLGANGAKLEASAKPVTVHYGGPVEPRQAFVLQSTGNISESSTKAGGKILFSEAGAALDSLTADGRPRHLVLALGYSGWAPGQLEREIERGSWYVGDWDEALVFGPDHAAKWDRAIARFGPEL